MKNTIKFLGIIALAAIIGFAMTACDEGDGDNSGGNNSSCDHNFGTITIVTQATETVDGKATTPCSKCKETVELALPSFNKFYGKWKNQSDSFTTEIGKSTYKVEALNSDPTYAGKYEGSSITFASDVNNSSIATAAIKKRYPVGITITGKVANSTLSYETNGDDITRTLFLDTQDSSKFNDGGMLDGPGFIFVKQ